jgi:hypothetical protein
LEPLELSGYSGKPLADKLGLKDGMKVNFIHVPKDYSRWIGPVFSQIKKTRNAPWSFVHLFTNKTAELESGLLNLRQQIEPHGMIWVSWYKKSAKLPTELTEDIIRDTALAIGLVDVKVCSVSDEWSALKLVIRKELR